jgi:predicted nucleic acid-binding protein
MINSCYLDTTILIEALFKTRRRRRKARAAVQAYAKSSLPVYAIKEMSAGALSHIVWLYNKLAETRSLARTHDALIANIRRPNRVTTSLADARSFAQTDRMQADMHALALRRIIQNGWRDRRRLTTEVVEELGCFPENPPYLDEELKMMTVGKRSCPDRQDCHFAAGLRDRPDDLNLLLEVIKGSTRPEDVRRRAALHVLKNTPRRKFEDQSCRGLGDAYFALNCPENATILTSNRKDHAPLAEALGKEVTEYRWKDE